MAIVTATGRIRPITTDTNGDIYILGNNSNEADVGGWAISLIPDAGGAFVGSIAILMRPEGKGAFDNNVGFVPCPYRCIVINGVPQTYQLDNIPLVGVCHIQVPSNGWSNAFAVVCSQGSASVYSRPLQGCTAP